MTDYTKVQTKMWHDPRFKRLSQRGKLFYLYLLTCPHRNLEGLFVLPIGYAAADLGWTEETVIETVTETVSEGLIDYDETVDLVLIFGALEFNSPANPNMVKSAVGKLESIPDSPLLERFLTEAERFSERLAKQLGERFREPLTHKTSTSTDKTLETSTTRQERDPDLDWPDGVPLPGPPNPETPAEIHAVAMLAAGYPNPPMPTGGELATIERALGRGHPPDHLADLGANAADKRDPKAYLLTAWQNLARSDPQPSTDLEAVAAPRPPDRRPAIPDFVPDGDTMRPDLAPTGIAAARRALEPSE